MTARQNSGKSSWQRHVIRLPSTTAGLSSQRAPALMRSSLKLIKPITRRQRTMSAEIASQGAWQIAATGLPAASISRTRLHMYGPRRRIYGENSPGIVTAAKSSV